jgi:protein-tyrosine phosphatase
VSKPPPGTTAVLNLCESADEYEAPVQRWRPIADTSPAPSLHWLQEQVDFVEDRRADGMTVFVHCMNGVSRSGLVVTAYLMREHGWSRDQALEFLRGKRPDVRPNAAFMKLLLEWEKQLRPNQ